MNEKEFLNAAINAVSELADSILDLSMEGIEKAECFVKVNELTYWLAAYQKMYLEVNEEGEENE